MRSLPISTFLFTSLLLATVSSSGAEAQGRVRGAKATAVPAKAKATAKVTATPTRKRAQTALSPKLAAARTHKLAKEYASEHNLEVRTLMAGPEGKQQQRVFVPILPSTFSAFQSKFAFSSGNKSIMLRHTFANKHLALSIEPTDIYFWGQNKNIGDTGNNSYKYNYMQRDGNHRNWAGSTIVVHPTSIPTLQKYLAGTAKGPRICPGNCMEWLPSAPTGPNTTLFHDLGITRSRDGNNMRAKIIHAGNHRVGVVGVHVTSLDQFQKMSESELLGRKPTGGVAEAQVKVTKN